MCGIIALPLLYDTPQSNIIYRGPDSTQKIAIDNYVFTFHRLRIMDITAQGDQPFINDKWQVMCNGEIFNHQQLKANFDYPYVSQSDCEVLLPLLQHEKLSILCNQLDGEWAFVAYNKMAHDIIAARDPMGIRPLFYGYCANGDIAFASEMKALLECCSTVYPFPPGFYYAQQQFHSYIALYKTQAHPIIQTPSQISQNIHDLLVNAVVKRLSADVPIGYLLSGGLDSSLVCSIANQYSSSPLTTFAIGLDHNPIDLKYAKQMANYLHSTHHEVIFSQKDIIDVLEQVIWVTETWDVTTIRASIPMYLLCKYIKTNTNIKVVMSGEISDELFGYKYTDFAPNAHEFQLESQKRIQELYMYDGLRADRCISANSLEARVPFSDKKFISYVMNIDPELKLNKYNMGKYLLRQAFANTTLLPEEILWRDKAAFSDAVGHGLVDGLTDLAEHKYSDIQFAKLTQNYTINPPKSKEALMYRELFNHHFPHQEHVISGYWLPNPNWPNCNLLDPSARYLPNYGKSGV